MTRHRKIAVWALTPNGGKLAVLIGGKMPDIDLHFSRNLSMEAAGIQRFSKIKEAVKSSFNRYNAHIFIMSTGIVVRLIAPLIIHKTTDPAVLVMDEQGEHVISLLSGHVGGANRLALKVAELTGARPVITTATDINNLVAIDEAAARKGLFIETPGNIKHVSMAVIRGEKIGIHDPYGFLSRELENVQRVPFEPEADVSAFLFIDDQVKPLPPKTLVLRPPSLVAGIGCNRGTGTEELKNFFKEVMDAFHLSMRSLKALASVDLKCDEPGLLALGKELKCPIRFFEKGNLDGVKSIQNPSTIVEKHIGIKSVCEAAAILGADQGKLIVPKQKQKNVTVAIARIQSTPFTS